ncbi:MAG: hypothetical protein Q4615_19135 [Paracoccus aminovorans]|nr:hypothetical protein [Paracoccus aminovorans]
MNEADTCRKLVVPKLQAAGWDDRPHAINEQRTFTDGRIVFVGGRARRGKQKRADYVLRYSPDFPIAVVEAKSRYRHAADGLQQAKDYAEVLVPCLPILDHLKPEFPAFVTAAGW